MAASMRTIVRVPKKIIQIAAKRWSRITVQTHILMKEYQLYLYHQRYLSMSPIMYADNPELPASEVKKLMESLTDKFLEARELLDDTRESKGTVYFSEDMKEAQQAVVETLREYKEFLEKLSNKQRQDVISTLGLRMEELKAQQAAIEEEMKHD